MQVVLAIEKAIISFKRSDLHKVNSKSTLISSFLRPHHNTTKVNSVGRALNFRYDENEVVCKPGLPVKDSNFCTMDFRFRMAISLESNNNTR